MIFYSRSEGTGFGIRRELGARSGGTPTTNGTVIYWTDPVTGFRSKHEASIHAASIFHGRWNYTGELLYKPGAPQVSDAYG